MDWDTGEESGGVCRMGRQLRRPELSAQLLNIPFAVLHLLFPLLCLIPDDYISFSHPPDIPL